MSESKTDAARGREGETMNGASRGHLLAVMVSFLLLLGGCQVQTEAYGIPAYTISAKRLYPEALAVAHKQDPGAFLAFVDVKTVGALILGATANVTQYALTQAVNDEPITFRNAAISAGAGLVGGAIAGPYTTNALRGGVDLVAARALAPNFYKEIIRQILWEDVRLGLGNLVRSAGGSFAANTLPTLVKPSASSPIPSTGSTEIVSVPAGGPIPW